MSKKKTDPIQIPETPETATSLAAAAAPETVASPAATAVPETAELSTAQEASEPPVCKTARLYMVREKRGLNLRPLPSMRPAPLEVLPYQAVVTATGEVRTAGDAEWLPVRAASGREGFAMLRYLEPMNDSEEDA